MRRHPWMAMVLGAVSMDGTVQARADGAFFRISAPTPTEIVAMDADGTIAWTGAAAGVTVTVQRAGSLDVASNWSDYVQSAPTDTVTTLRVIDPAPPAGMVYIPAGLFAMGDSFAEDHPNSRPVHTVYTSAFYMDKYEVTKAMWDEVYAWAITNGYTFRDGHGGKASNHPVHTVNWYDCLKWCNARSQKEGLTPCYMIGETVYQTDTNVPTCVWSANGYRLPTEAEWEKAARGGIAGRRFPWGDLISWEEANYYSYWETDRPFYPYDKAPDYGDHPTYATGVFPYTSPVGSFAANGYGLFDMVGNVQEWCWDWYSPTNYVTSPSSDPRGWPWGDARILRGGDWGGFAVRCRSANRFYAAPSYCNQWIGFRSVRASSP